MPCLGRSQWSIFMAPLFPRTFALQAPFDELQLQWTHPSDVFSVLLLLGGDVISRALAQLAGGIVTPVTFSFGWVAYAVAAIVSCAGDNRLMPTTPDCASVVINGKSGYVRSNSSWILGRIVRDYEYWMPRNAKNKLEHLFSEVQAHQQAKALPGEIVPTPTRAGLFVSVFKASKVKTAGEPDVDAVWYSGIVVAIIQLGVACIPFGLFGDWSILLITVLGIILCFASGSLPQWKKEKWNCRRNTDQNYILTRGNGAQHAIVILGDGHGLNLEDLAAVDSNTDSNNSWFTRVALVALAFFWIALLIFAAGLQENTWFLLAVGGLGILHNAVVAGWPRRPENFGVHLETEKFISGPKVMGVLMETERNFPHIGRAMLPTFFPGKLWAEEEKEWNLFELDAAAYDADLKAQRAEDAVSIIQTRGTASSKESYDSDDEVNEAEKKAYLARSIAHNLKEKAVDARQAAQNLKKASHAMTI